MILALDATMNSIGAALFDEEGNLLGVSCIKYDKRISKEAADMAMAKELDEIIRVHDITEIAVEVTKGKTRNYEGAKSQFKAEGMVLYAAAIHGLKYHAISPYDAKFAAVNRKREVSKDEMILAAEHYCPDILSRKVNGSIHKGKAEHEADAIFVGRAFFAQRKYRAAISK